MEINENIKRSTGVVTADIEDNCIQHGIRGMLEHENIEKMIALYDTEDIQARIHGKFQHLTGLVFKNFDRKIHVIKPFTITKRDFVTIESLDTHPRNEDAALWLATDRQGRKIVIDELYGHFTTSELARRIKSKADNYRIVKRLLEPQAFTLDQHQENPSEQTLAYRLEVLGLEYEPATKTRTKSNRRIKDAFDYEMVGSEMLVAPELFIFDTCQRTIWEIEHWQWDDWRGKAAERKSPMEKTMDKDDHMIEALGRALIQEIPFTPYIISKGSTVYGNDIKFDPYDN